MDRDPHLVIINAAKFTERRFAEFAAYAGD